MKVGYKHGKGKRGAKGKRKAQQSANALADLMAGVGLDGSKSHSDLDGTLANTDTAKSKKRREMARKQDLKAKAVTLKKTKMKTRKGAAKGVQGLTNRTNHQMNQNILALAQDLEALGQAGKSHTPQKNRKNKQKQRRARKAQAEAGQAQQAADMEMQA